MKIHMASGTVDYLTGLKEKYPEEKMILMSDEEQAVLIHETDGESVFNEPQIYEVLDASGTLENEGFAVLNNIPVNDEGRIIFEDRFKKRAGLVEKEKGFGAIRVLRPLMSDTYIILTIWQDEGSFTDWQESNAYGKAHAKRGTDDGIDKRPNIFPRPSYVNKLHITQ